MTVQDLRNKLNELIENGASPLAEIKYRSSVNKKEEGIDYIIIHQNKDLYLLCEDWY